MKRLIPKTSIFTIAIVIGITIFPACSSSRNSGGNNSSEPVSETKQNQTNTTENSQVNAKETPKATPAKQTDGLPAFKVGEDYKSSVRVKMLKAGWEPHHSADAQLCGSGDSTCDEFPEMESCAGTGAGNCKFLWKRGGKLAAIFTVDDPQVFSSSEFETLPKQSKQTTAAGKYEFVEVGFSGEHTLELKSDYSASFKLLEEDGSSNGTGSWNWDESKELLTVTLSIKTEVAGSDENEKPMVSKAVFQFKKEGKNLRVVEENWSPDRIYVGKIFKKL